MKDLILKYIKKDKKEDIFHSSVYARAQGKANFGAASTESFSKRRQLDKNRQVVRGYSESHIANNAASNGPHAKPYVPPKPKASGGPRPAGPKY